MLLQDYFMQNHTDSVMGGLPRCNIYPLHLFVLITLAYSNTMYYYILCLIPVQYL